jgi:hypothetical protein
MKKSYIGDICTAVIAMTLIVCAFASIALIANAVLSH